MAVKSPEDGICGDSASVGAAEASNVWRQPGQSIAD